MSNLEVVQLITQCKSELLNHTLQEQVASENIRNINKYLDKCLDVLHRADSANESKSRGSRISGNNKDNVLFFSFCMSKYDYPFLISVTGLKCNQSEAFSYLATKLGVKASTIRQYRDYFDSHVSQTRSNRQGWKSDISPALQEIINRYDSLGESELIKQAKVLLKP